MKLTEAGLKRLINSIVKEMKWEPKGPLDREWLNTIAQGADPTPEISPELVRELGDWIVSNDELGQLMDRKECVESLYEALMEEQIWQTMNLEAYELTDALKFMIDSGVVIEESSGYVFVENLSSVMRLASSIN